MGSRRFELLTSAMSRRRHSQLDHEPSKMGKCFFNLDHPNIKKLAFLNASNAEMDIPENILEFLIIRF
jgi:hypothetical protein